MLSFDHVSLVGPAPALTDAGLCLTPTQGPLRASGWCLRPVDPGRIALSLAALDVGAAEATPFHGADGTWSDSAAHPNGAVSVAELQLATPNPATLTRLLARLGAIVIAADVTASPTAAAHLELGRLVLVVIAARYPALSALTLRARDGRRLRVDLSA